MNIVKNGSNYRFYNATEILETLELGTYTYGNDMFGGYLDKVEASVFPEKIYSNDEEFIKHVMYTWENNKSSVGILLYGLKGLGEQKNSLTCRLVQK